MVDFIISKPIVQLPVQFKVPLEESLFTEVAFAASNAIVGPSVSTHAVLRATTTKTQKASESEEIACKIGALEEISVADVGVHLVAGIGVHLGAFEICWPCSQSFFSDARIRSGPRTGD